VLDEALLGSTCVASDDQRLAGSTLGDPRFTE